MYHNGTWTIWDVGSYSGPYTVDHIVLSWDPAEQLEQDHPQIPNEGKKEHQKQKTSIPVPTCWGLL